MSYGSDKSPKDSLFSGPEPEERASRHAFTASLAALGLMATLVTVAAGPRFLEYAHGQLREADQKAEEQAQLGNVIERSLLSVGGMIARMPGRRRAADGADFIMQATSTVNCRQANFSETVLPLVSRTSPREPVEIVETIERADTLGCSERQMQLATVVIRLGSPAAPGSDGRWSVVYRATPDIRMAAASTETSKPRGEIAEAEQAAAAAEQYALNY